MRNAGLEETQTGIQIAGRNINNLRYANESSPRCVSISASQVEEGLKVMGLSFRGFHCWGVVKIKRGRQILELG